MTTTNSDDDGIDFNFRIYFAGSYESKVLVDTYAGAVCRSLNDVIRMMGEDDGPMESYTARPCSSWHRIPAHDGDGSHVAQDLADLGKAHVLVASYPGGVGTAAEMGFALGRGIPVYYVYDEFYEDDLPWAAHAPGTTRIKYGATSGLHALTSALMDDLRKVAYSELLVYST